MMCPLEKIQASKLVFDIENLMKTKESLEMRIRCNFKVAERARYELIEKGFNVKIYSEFKYLCVGVWKT